MPATPNTNPVLIAKRTIDALYDQGLSRTNNNFDAAVYLAKAALHQPDSLPIEWHKSVLEAGVEPTAESFRVMQAVSAEVIEERRQTI